MIERKFSLRRRPADGLDWSFSQIMRAPVSLPSKVSLKKYCGPIRDQGEAGFCHAFAAAAMKNVQENMENHVKFDTSPLYIAETTKRIDPLPNEEGTYLIYSCKALCSDGTVDEIYYPYSCYIPGTLKFPNKQSIQAPVYKSENYAACYNVDDIRLALSMNKPVLMGIVVTSNFYVVQDGKEKFVPLPNGYLLGGHAMLVVGYDDTLEHDGHKGHFILQNSWGEECGEKGFIYLPYDYLTYKVYLTDKQYMTFFMDAWTTIDLKNDPIKNTIIELWVNQKTALLNKKSVELDVAPMIDINSSRTLIPLRFIAESLGCEVKWEDANKKITLTQGATTIILTIGSKYATINGKPIELDCAPVIDAKSSRTLVPLRFVSESFGAKVFWDDRDKHIVVTKD